MKTTHVINAVFTPCTPQTKEGPQLFAPGNKEALSEVCAEITKYLATTVPDLEWEGEVDWDDGSYYDDSLEGEGKHAIVLAGTKHGELPIEPWAATIVVNHIAAHLMAGPHGAYRLRLTLDEIVSMPSIDEPLQMHHLTVASTTLTA